MDKQQKEKLKKFFAKDTFAKKAGVKLTDLDSGTATAEMTLSESHLNGHNMPHGAALFTLADLAFAVAANSYGTTAVAVNVNIAFTKAAKIGDTLTAKAFENAKSNKIGNYTVKITDQNKNLVATFNGTAYRKKEKF
jgi:acyl-CoA thioesterase